jgi:A/G-specific adenine glycosylase
MELGATVCTPRSPMCGECPLRRQCKARAAAAQERIPVRRARKATPLVERDVYRVRNARGEFLIEQRPETGRWAGLWQFPTRARGAAPPVKGRAALLGTIAHALTHRRYAFRVFGVSSEAPAASPARWVAGDRLDDYPMPRPHVLVRGMADSPEVPA